MLRSNMNPMQEKELDHLLGQLSRVKAEMYSFKVKQRLTIIEKLQRMMLLWKKREIMRKLFALMRACDDIDDHVEENFD